MPPEPPRVYRVAELARRIRTKLERWGEVWVEGELSDVTRRASGHLYFTLDDGAEQAQLRCVMFRGDARFARAKMEDGQRVRVLGMVTLYEPRGSFQLIARIAVSAGEGDRRAELDKLKKKLAGEGLFARKRPLPRFPSVVGVVTSLEGAALHDIVRVASARAPVRIVVSHCQVQGPEAPIAIVKAIRRVCRVRGLDVVIVTRGGGATDDLAPFNDERVARAMAECPVPIVSGVGHEIDETIADLVADVRAATPSNAAELVVPDANALITELDASRRRVERALEVAMGRERLRLERLGRRMRDPRRELMGARHRMTSAGASIERALDRSLARRRAALGALAHRLARLEPRAALGRDRAALDALRVRLEAAGRTAIAERRRALARTEIAAPAIGRSRAALATLAARLSALSPLHVLARGYAIALKDGRALLSAADAKPGDVLTVRLARGSLGASVTRVEEET